MMDSENAWIVLHCNSSNNDDLEQANQFWSLWVPSAVMQGNHLALYVCFRVLRRCADMMWIQQRPIKAKIRTTFLRSLAIPSESLKSGKKP
jgi:hypothetical protein